MKVIDKSYMNHTNNDIKINIYLLPQISNIAIQTILW